MILKEDDMIGENISAPVENNLNSPFDPIFSQIYITLKSSNLPFTEKYLKMVVLYQLNSDEQINNPLLASVSDDDEYLRYLEFNFLYSENPNAFKKLSNEFIQALLCYHKKIHRLKRPYDFAAFSLYSLSVFFFILFLSIPNPIFIWSAVGFFIAMSITFYMQFTNLPQSAAVTCL